MAGKKKAAAPKKEAEMMLVQSKVKDFVKGHEMQSAGDLVEALNEQVAVFLERAVARAKANDRKTLRPGDL